MTQLQSGEFDPHTIYGPCSVCGAVQIGYWPHPLGEPCPRKVAIDDAYIAMLDAQRMTFIRAGEGASDAFRRMIGEDE